MYGGKIIEMGTVDEIFYDPQHPYTWGLISSMPTLDTKDEELYVIPGTPPDLLNPPKGDAFAARNEYAMQIDLEEHPPMFKVSDTHYAATWLCILMHRKLSRLKKLKDVTSNSPRKGGRINDEMEKLVEIKNLKQYFNQGKANEVKAVDDISFDIYKGETLGLVGRIGLWKINNRQNDYQIV